MDVGIGIDVGGTNILSVALDATGAVVAESAAVAAPASRADFAELLERAVHELADSLGRGAVVRGIGFALPGFVDRAGVLHDAPNLPAARGFDVKAALGGVFGRLASHATGGEPRLVIDNDGSLAAVGELVFGRAQGASDVIVLTLGTGIGGGIIADGQVVRGGRGFAGEVGHIVLDPHGPPCPCGGRGCWEQYASGTGLARLAREAAEAGEAPALVAAAGGSAQAIRGEHVVELARAGVPDVSPVLERFARALAWGIGNLVEVLDPEEVVLGGGLVRAADVYLPRVRALFASHRRGSGDHAVPITAAKLAERAGAIGAAAAALGLG